MGNRRGCLTEFNAWEAERITRNGRTLPEHQQRAKIEKACFAAKEWRVKRHHESERAQLEHDKLKLEVEELKRKQNPEETKLAGPLQLLDLGKDPCDVPGKFTLWPPWWLHEYIVNPETLTLLALVFAVIVFATCFHPTWKPVAVAVSILAWERHHYLATLYVIVLVLLVRLAFWAAGAVYSHGDFPMRRTKLLLDEITEYKRKYCRCAHMPGFDAMVYELVTHCPGNDGNSDDAKREHLGRWLKNKDQQALKNIYFNNVDPNALVHLMQVMTEAILVASITFESTRQTILNRGNNKWARRTRTTHAFRSGKIVLDKTPWLVRIFCGDGYFVRKAELPLN
jgi:hypothetical protein